MIWFINDHQCHQKSQKMKVLMNSKPKLRWLNLSFTTANNLFEIHFNFEHWTFGNSILNKMLWNYVLLKFSKLHIPGYPFQTNQMGYVTRYGPLRPSTNYRNYLELSYWYCHLIECLKGTQFQYLFGANPIFLPYPVGGYNMFF